MASFPIPKRLANDRVVQCVEVSSGASWQVTRTISATVPSARAGLRPRPLAITPTPSAPFCVEAGPPPTHRVRVDLAPASDLLVGQALGGPQQGLRLDHLAVRQRRGRRHLLQLGPLCLGHRQRRCGHHWHSQRLPYYFTDRALEQPQIPTKRRVIPVSYTHMTLPT